MQQCTFLVLALVASPVVGVSVSASSTATAWLQNHKSPTDNQLGELANANPAAFAIVQALLSKHAKGGVTLAPEERGPDVFRNMMTPRHLSSGAAMPYASAELAEVSHPVVDQKSFNPNAAADRDESAVSRLLAAVAQLGGKKGQKIALLNHRRHTTEVADNALTSDASLFADAAPTAAPMQAVEAQVAAAVEPPTPVAQPVAPAAPKENSYLKGIDLSGDMPSFLKTTPKQKKFLHDNSPDTLASFSFDDSAAATPAPKKVVAPKPKKENSFLKWLSGSKKVEAPVAEEKPVEKKAAVVNPYAGWLGN